MGPYVTPNTPPTSLKHGNDMSTIHNASVCIYLLVEMGMNSLSVLYLSQSGCSGNVQQIKSSDCAVCI